MDDKLIKKYLNYKKKKFNNYAKLIIKIIKIKPSGNVNDNNLWNNKKEFLKNFSLIIDKYFDEFYLEKELDTDTFKKYYDLNISSNNTLLGIFLSIIIYFKGIGKETYLKSNKEDIMLMAVIIYMAHNLDSLINITEEFNYKVALEKVLKIFSNINLLTVYDRKRKEVESIINYARTSYEKEKRFILSLDCDISYNMYKSVSNENKFFLVEYQYFVKDIEKYKSEDIRFVFNNLGLEEELLMNSYELINVLLLKQLMCKKNNVYILPIVKNIYSKNKNLKKLQKLFNYKNFKNSIMFMINYKEYVENKTAIDKFSKNFQLLINIEEDNNINIDLIKDKKIISESKLIKKYNFDNYIEKKVDILLSEKEILGVK